MRPSFRRFASILAAVALVASPLRGVVMCEMPPTAKASAQESARDADGDSHADAHVHVRAHVHADVSAPAVTLTSAQDETPSPVDQTPAHCDDLSACASAVALAGSVAVPFGSALTGDVAAAVGIHPDAPARLVEPPPPRG
ncbi:MAG: hypothetical protein ACKVS7_01730 [Gemmatimonadaceae bacterium]